MGPPSGQLSRILGWVEGPRASVRRVVFLHRDDVAGRSEGRGLPGAEAKCPVRPVSNAQVRKLTEEMSKHGQIGQAAMRRTWTRMTAWKYVAAGQLPSEMTPPRDWRTRPDPFEEHWPELEAKLQATPELEAKTLFGLLQQAPPGRYEDGQTDRTLQRHVKRWRAAHGLVSSPRPPRWPERNPEKPSSRTSPGTSGRSSMGAAGSRDLAATARRDLLASDCSSVQRAHGTLRTADEKSL